MTVDETERPPAILTGRLASELKGSIAGEVLVPGDAGYDQARRVWNGAIDRYPAVIARCTSSADVAEVVRIAGRYRPEVSVRGGGHQIAGSAVCQDGLVIDLSPMRTVEVDPGERTARVQAGARWADVDRATQRHALACTGGEVSQTGVAGLTLGGGLGLLHRAFGLACDNVRAVEIVTADGVIRRASDAENQDLWWAARGAGRGIGVVTEFEFTLHELGPDVATAQVVYPYAQAESAMRAWRDAALTAPETVSPEAVLWTLPADPAFPEDLHGVKVFIAAGVFAGDPRRSAEALAPYGRLGVPLLDLSGTSPYVELQSELDQAFPDGGRYFFKSHFLDELTDEAIATLVRCDEQRPNAESIIGIRTLGGAIDRVPRGSSAYPHRGARFNLSVDGVWTDPGDDDKVIGWARETWEALRPFANGGVYLNFAGFEGECDVAATLGDTAERLRVVCRRYDPTGLFAAAARKP